jgi:hypothetical protein
VQARRVVFVLDVSQSMGIALTRTRSRAGRVSGPRSHPPVFRRRAAVPTWRLSSAGMERRGAPAHSGLGARVGLPREPRK